MVRPFAVKGRKRKQKEKYDKDSEDEQEQKHLKVEAEEPAADNHDEQPEDVEGKVAEALEGIPIVPVEKKSGRDSGIIFVLEKASLELAKVGKNYQLLNSDDHANFLKKNSKNPAEYRPDIVHQALLSILDSPLNKAGKVCAVYVRTEKSVLIDVKPHVRLPRTYTRFAGIMMQLLQTLSISASGKREKLLRVIKNPVTQYLPVNARKVGFSSKGKLVEMQDYVASIDNDTPLVFVVGAMAHGKIVDEYADDFLAISNYPLSAACCINTICEAVRRHLKFI